MATATTVTPVQAAAASDVAQTVATKVPSGKLASVVVAPEYAVSVKTKLTMQNPDEVAVADAGHVAQEYHVSDAKGKTFFMLKPSATSFMSSGGKKQLFDAHGRPLVDLEKKMISMHGTWLLTRTADASRIAEVKPSKNLMNVYLNDGDKEPDYIIAGADKNFTIKDCHRKNAVIATVKKGSGGFACMKPKTAAEAGKYNVLIHPGVDAAFVTALAMICENVHGKKST